jgi:hypothetical protein
MRPYVQKIPFYVLSVSIMGQSSSLQRAIRSLGRAIRRRAQEGKIVTVRFDVNTLAQRFNVSVVKPFLEPEIPVFSLSSDTPQKSNI